MRTQFRLVEGDYIGITLSDWGGFYTYARLASDGSVSIGQRAMGESEIAIASTDLIVTQEDVVMQIDASDDTLAVRVWRAGDNMPTEPLLACDVWPITGFLALEVNAESGSRTQLQGIFRYVHLADSMIPEPSTLLLSLLALVAFGGFWKRR